MSDKKPTSGQDIIAQAIKLAGSRPIVPLGTRLTDQGRREYDRLLNEKFPWRR